MCVRVNKNMNDKRSSVLMNNNTSNNNTSNNNKDDDDDIKGDDNTNSNSNKLVLLDRLREFTNEELMICERVLEKIATNGKKLCNEETYVVVEEEDNEDNEDDDDDDDEQKKKKKIATTTTTTTTKAVIDLKEHKNLRKALLPLLEMFTGRLYRGKDPTEYRKEKQSKVARNDRNQRLKALDREAVGKANMRRDRLAKLAKLENERGDLVGAEGLSLPIVPDGVAILEEEEEEKEKEKNLEQQQLHNPNSCYCCKKRYTEVHHFYATMCPPCAEENYYRRSFSCNMEGRVCIVTGARVKIGFRVALKLLKAGAFVVATSRFPEDARERFRKYDEELLEKKKQTESFMSRLKVVAMDLRDLPALEKLCEKLNNELPRLDVIINNACQTVRRPPVYYKHLLKGELVKKRARVADSKHADSRLKVGNNKQLSIFNDDDDEYEWTAPASVLQSQLQVLEDDKDTNEMNNDLITNANASSIFPENVFDVNGQQVDLRKRNSWTMKLGEIETPELLEVLAVNAAAPFVLNGKLRALMKRTAKEPLPSSSSSKKDRDNNKSCCAFIVNVSAMEGKFYRYKTANHPHTNMAKAALNMMTATSARDYASDNIFMTAVDTGWINDENPLPVASRIAREHNFQTPIDEEDAAARILNPIFESLFSSDDEEEAEEFKKKVFPPKYGVFLKDYRISEW